MEPSLIYDEVFRNLGPGTELEPGILRRRASRRGNGLRGNSDRGNSRRGPHVRSTRDLHGTLSIKQKDETFQRRRCEIDVSLGKEELKMAR